MGTGIVEFLQLREVGVFFYLDILCLKSHEMVLGVVRPEMAMDSGFKKWNRCLMRGSSLDSPQTGLGRLKTALIFLLDRNCPCEFV